MANTFPKTPRELDRRLDSINSLASTAHYSGLTEEADHLINMAICLLLDSEESEAKEEPAVTPELPKVCDDPGCGICHPWNKEVE